MAKSLQKQIEEADFINVESADITELQGDIDDTLNTIKKEFDADENDVTFFIKVYRVELKTGKSSWLFNCQPEELPIMEKLRDSYGTGIYQVRVYKNQKLNRRFNYQIEAPKIVERQQNNNNDIASILKSITENNQKQFDQMRQLMLEIAATKQATVLPQQAFNPMEMMMGMVSMMTQLKTLMPVASSGGDNVNLVLKGMEIMKDFQGGGSETTLMDVVRDLIKSPMLEKVIETTTANPNPPKVRKPSQPQISLPQTTQTTQTTQTKQEGEQVNPIIKGYINTLVKKAATGSDPELYAEFILDNVPEKLIRENILRDDLMEFIIGINPEAANYPDWFGELKNCLLDFLDGESDEILTNEPVAANTHNNEPGPDNHADDNS